MNFNRSFVCVLLLLGSTLFFSCKKEDPTPVGNLEMRITHSGRSTGAASYQLFTEVTWTQSGGAGPLRSGQVFLNPTPSGSTSSIPLMINDLNPGNYVFRLADRAVSVQVTAGKTAPFSLSLL